MTSNPSIVIFDIGNVLIKWDMRHVYRSMFDTEEHMERFISETALVDWNVEQDKGRNWREAEDLLIADFPHYEAEIRAFRARWHDMVPGAIEQSVAIKERLEATGAPLYAITNFAADTFAESQERFPVLANFEDVVVSAQVGLIKPDPAIYQLLLDRNGLAASDCIFIDDSLANIATARQLGMHVHHFTAPEDLRRDLQRLGFDV